MNPVVIEGLILNPKFAIEPILRRESLHKRIQANFGFTSVSIRKSLRDSLGRPCPMGRADFAIAKSGLKEIGIDVRSLDH